MTLDRPSSMPPEELLLNIQNENRKFKDYYLWLEKAMPPAFFEEISRENAMLISHTLMGFDLQAYFSTIHLKNGVLVMCLDSPDADLRILENYALYGIKNYRAYVSNTPLPSSETKENLRIASILFTQAKETGGIPLSSGAKEGLYSLVKEHNEGLSRPHFDDLIDHIDGSLLRALPTDRLVSALNMFFRAQTRDTCQYEVHYHENWKETSTPSMQIVMAWRNTPKHHFLYRIARVIHRHGLVLKCVHASYINTANKNSILLMVLELHGGNGEAVWDVANIPEFLRELLTVKYFASFDLIDAKLVGKKIISGNMGNFLRSTVNFIHQALVYIDPNVYTLENIESAICRHPELTVKMCEAFRYKFDPECHDHQKYKELREAFLLDIDKLDTGQEENDIRSKNILKQGMNFIHHTYKTNFYRTILSAHSFRLNPEYLNDIPFNRKNFFPEMPYAIFFIKGMHFFGFHIRFKDLSRGGLRTVSPAQADQVIYERNQIFAECYNLALTQHMKNKDIPEGGSKGIIFLNLFKRMESESLIFQKELENLHLTADEINQKLKSFQKEQKLEYLHQAQRSFVESLLVIVNCNENGEIRAKNIIDYWKKPEYLYLGPDENMHDEMIQWIADMSKRYGYRPGGAFISGKALTGINHKEYGVTSLGVNVYMEALLKFIGIDPKLIPFTVKMSGGPDGDVAGNQINNLHRFYHKTAKLLTLVDVSGVIYDSKGLDLDILAELFRQGKPVKYYPPERLSDGGFLLDKNAKRMLNSLSQQTLCRRMTNGQLEEQWLSGDEMNHILRTFVLQTKADMFIPAGGRPRTIDESNTFEFLDAEGKPSAKCIVEGANLYLTPKARSILEKLGVLIIKDSSANKTGVICSSFEVLCGLVLKDEEFIKNRERLIGEVLWRLERCAAEEAELLLKTYRETKESLPKISERISERINQFTYEILDYLNKVSWNNDPADLLTKCCLDYCLPLLRDEYREQTLRELPDHHKKAIVACHLAAQLVYRKGLSWQPTVVDILPLLLKEV